MSHPATLEELFGFYNSYVKLLYSAVQADGTLPVEILYEINAAFDHVSRKWVYDEDEEAVVGKAYSHLKRSCLDIFKIKLRDTIDDYKKLCEVDTSILDNGSFDGRMHKFVYELRKKASVARRVEGKCDPDENSAIESFEYWQPVYEDCLEFEKAFFLHSGLPWAKKKLRKYSLKALFLSVLVSFTLGLGFDILWEKGASQVKNKLNLSPSMPMGVDRGGVDLEDVPSD